MTRDEYRPTAIPPDGRPRRIDAGWFVAYTVEAVDAAGAIIQAKIESKRARLKWLDVANVSQGESVPSSIVRYFYVVELMVDGPTEGLGL